MIQTSYRPYGLVSHMIETCITYTSIRCTIDSLKVKGAIIFDELCNEPRGLCLDKVQDENCFSISFHQLSIMFSPKRPQKTSLIGARR